MAKCGNDVGRTWTAVAVGMCDGLLKCVMLDLRHYHLCDGRAHARVCACSLCVHLPALVPHSTRARPPSRHQAGLAGTARAWVDRPSPLSRRSTLSTPDDTVRTARHSVVREAQGGPAATGGREYAMPLSHSRCRCGRGEPGPGADVAGVSPVPVQMWQG
jgi:hypothetical protein